MSRTTAYIAAESNAGGSSVRVNRAHESVVKRVVARKLTAISQNAMATSPHTTAVTLRGMVTAKIAVISSFFTTSRRTSSGPEQRTFRML